MNPELEKLIDLAIADGVVTDKEKQVLLKKAQASGVDEDEFEMVLEGKLHLATMQQAQAVQPSKPTSNKEGTLKKCPSCGATAQAFATRCSDCGHDFQNVQSNSSIQNLFELLNAAENARSNGTSDMFGKLQSVFGVSDLDKKKMEIISSFPIPNSKADILEFLALAAPKAKIKKGFLGIAEVADDKIPNMYARVWKQKCEQIIIKARFSMKGDRSTLEEIERYAQQLGIKQ